MRQQAGQAADVLAVDLDQSKRRRRPAVDLGMGGLDQRALAHAAGAPEQRVVRWQAAGEAASVVEQDLDLPVDPAQEVERHAADRQHRVEPVGPARFSGMPDEGVRGLQVEGWRRRRGGPFQGRGDPLQGLEQAILCPSVEIRHRHPHLCADDADQARTAGPRP